MRKFEKVSYDNSGILPTIADVRSAGYDLYTPTKVVIPPHSTVKVISNIKCYMDSSEVLLLFVRSSIGIKKNIMLSNTTGVIDSSYVDNPDNEGNIIFALYNYGDIEQVIDAGDRVVQGVFMKYLTTDDDSTTNTERTGGIGSSGK